MGERTRQESGGKNCNAAQNSDIIQIRVGKMGSEQYITYSEFVRKDKTMEEIDSIIGEPYDFSEIDAMDISGQEKSAHKEEAKNSLWSLFDHIHPIHIYKEESPRIILVGSGAVTSNRMPDLCSFYKEKENANRFKAIQNVSKNAIFMQVYHCEGPKKQVMPVMYMHTGIRFQVHGQGENEEVAMPIPSWFSQFTTPTRKTPLQVLREGALCAWHIATKGVADFALSCYVDACIVERRRTRARREEAQLLQRVKVELMNMRAIETIANRFPIPYMVRKGMGTVSSDETVSAQGRNAGFRCYSAHYRIHPTQFALMQGKQAGG